MHQIFFIIRKKQYFSSKFDRTKMSEKYKEKLNLLSEMIAFAQIDGELHEKEYQLLQLVACELQIKNVDFKDLFQSDIHLKGIKSSFERMQQFYRLALLMHVDGIIHQNENNAIHEIGIKMALNPFAIDRILKAINTAPQKIIDPLFLISVFSEQLN